METIKIRLARIRIDGGTQNRVAINQDTVAEYAEAMTEGAQLPPVILFHDGADYWLADGFHRYHATKSIGALDIDATVANGTQRDARLYSFGANSSHGLKRTNADKRKAVEDMLKDEVWGQWSEREIARACNVSHMFVNGIKKNVTVNIYSEKSEVKYKDKYGNESVMKTGNIGKKDVTVNIYSEKSNQGEKNESSKNNENRRQENDQDVQGNEGENSGGTGDGDDTDERDQIIREQSDVIEDLVKENDRIKALLANNQVPEGLEVPDVDTLIDEKNARIKQLEIELKAVTTSRDSLMREVNELKVQIKKYQAVLRKQGERDAVS